MLSTQDGVYNNSLAEQVHSEHYINNKVHQQQKNEKYRYFLPLIEFNNFFELVLFLNLQQVEGPLKFIRNHKNKIILEMEKFGKFEQISNYDGVVKSLIFPDEDINPFCSKMNDQILNHMGFPLPHHAVGYCTISGNVPPIGKYLKLGGVTLSVIGDIGKGAYARIIKVICENTTYAMKIQKPACKWEHYIIKEIQKRVDPKMKSSFIDVNHAYIFNNGSILETNFAKFGTLLTVCNMYKTHLGRRLETGVIIHFSIEMVDIIDHLHRAKIIHGDVKPDNFVVRSLPNMSEPETCIQLIDFGRSIDMTLFPEGTKFKQNVTTEGFQCNEMKENKPWTYQTDLYGLAGSIYCLLAGEYMKVVKKNDQWKYTKVLPRCLRKEIWDPIFSKLLNIESCDKLPDLGEIKSVLDQHLKEIDQSIIAQNMKDLGNVLLVR